LAQFLQASIGDGFIPTVAGDRGLDRTLAPLRAINATTEKADLVAGTEGVDLILGRGGDDTVFGFQGNDRIYGGGGKDRLTGGTGNDLVVGGDGNDVISGGSGNDLLIGSAGGDIQTGGLGRDRFDFNFLSESGRDYATRDRITDFQHGRDRLDLISLDANGAATGNNAFLWKGTAAFSRRAGELHAVKINHTGTANDKTIVEGDVNGDGRADFQIELKGLIALTAADFVL
jgi:Ca2+-binding RTX toxin-like protein